LPLSGTPSALQPTAAVRAEFPEGSIGAIKQVSVAIAHTGGELAFRLEWNDTSAESGADGQEDVVFPDGAAILLPVRPGAPLMTMGAPGQPVNAWYWRADENGVGRHVTAQGLGTTETIDRESVKCRGIHRQGGWVVVIGRRMRVKGSQLVAQIDVGAKTAFSVAIWEGGHRERAGIKSFALGALEGWHALTLNRSA
jgi:DMSO reductase family type II enzyme heme b subunit